MPARLQFSALSQATPAALLGDFERLGAFACGLYYENERIATEECRQIRRRPRLPDRNGYD
jgi:hypothetical protein